MKRMWRPSCFFLKHGGGFLALSSRQFATTIINIYLVCILYYVPWYIFSHGTLCASHNLVRFSFLSERSGRRKPPAERGALHYVLFYNRCLSLSCPSQLSWKDERCLRVATLATGNKCVGWNRIPEDGSVVHDSHAEVSANIFSGSEIFVTDIISRPPLLLFFIGWVGVGR